MKLWPHQKRAVKAAFREWKKVRSTLYVCPTAGGKSHVFTEIARRSRPLGKTLFLAAADSLVMQAESNILKHTKLTTGIEKAHRHVDVRKLPDVVCATIQSIRQPKRLKRFPRDAFALVIVDEADLAVTDSYADVLARFPGAKVFGCTATPDRHDGQSLEGVFESICAEDTIRDLIRKGYLSRIDRQSIKIESVDLARVPSRKGDFNEKALGRILALERPVHEVVKPTLELSGKRPTIVFAATVPHAQALAMLFNRYRRGSARAIHGKMSIKARAAVMADFEAGRFQFLCNCVLLLRGVNVPFVSCISMARPTKSRALYCQALGRGMRLSPATGKKNLLVIDFTDNSETHSLIGVVDIIGADRSPEERERTREILNEEPGKDVLSALDVAVEQLKRDPEMSARVKAVVAFRARRLNSLAIDWDKQPLGLMPDNQLARELGCSRIPISMAREARCIPAYGIDWSALPLGEMPDMVLADLLAFSFGAVQHARLSRKIPSFRSTRFDWDNQPLGEMADSELARQLGCATSSVSYARHARGIATPTYRRESMIDWDHQPLGDVPDAKIAAKIGCTPSTVMVARRRLGIVAFRFKTDA